MKGFPNQIADLSTITKALQVAAEILQNGGNPADDGEFGEQLVRSAVIRTGHKPIPVDEYLQLQRTKPASNQSFRTTARGLRELFRILKLIETHQSTFQLTTLGCEIVALDANESEALHVLWRKIVREMTHSGGGRESHPYQVLLRLVARVPGISRAKCALALEARDDSTAELDRIVRLAGRDEAEIIRTIGVTQSNWDNAKKVLPKFAEQLGDVLRASDGSYTLAAVPGQYHVATGWPIEVRPYPRRVADRPKTDARKVVRKVTPNTIGVAGTSDDFDELEDVSGIDAQSMRRTIELRRDRLRRHNLIVKRLAASFSEAGSELYENPFDVLAVKRSGSGVLVEVKTLDGSDTDEIDRVRDALAQLLYYEAFALGVVKDGLSVTKVACFESAISEAHQQWLRSSGIRAMWLANGADGWGGDVADVFDP